MPSHNSAAAQARQMKENHPERYCPHPRCLWVITGQRGSPCKNHPTKEQQ